MKSPKRLSVTALASVVALIAGIGLGLAVFQSQSPRWLAVADNVSAVGTLWSNALRMTIIPLVISMLVVAVAGNGNPRGVTRLSGITAATFVSLLITGTILVLLLLPPVLPRLHIAPGQLSTLTSSAVARTEESPGTDSSFKSLIATLLPSNLVKAAADDDLLPIVLFAVLLGLAVTRIEVQQRELLVNVLRALANSVLVIIHWILLFMPIGVFAFSFSATATVGWNTVGILGAWIGIVSTLCVIFAGGLYVIASVVGRVPVKDFAKAAIAAQGVGLTTRSSLAALPAMLEGVRKHLRTDETVANLVLPVAVSSFKINRSINGFGRLLLLAYVFDISLSPVAIVVFVATNLLMSFSSPGLPAKGPGATLPLYIAAGIPVEGVILLKSADAITDFAMTFLNVTGDLTAMTIVARFYRINESATSSPTAGIDLRLPS